MILTTAAVLVGPALACSDGTRVDGRPQRDAVVVIGEATDTLTLYADSPRASIPIDAGDVADAELLLVTVAEVVNPDRREIAISVSLEDRADERLGTGVTIGAIALFPVDQGGTFSLRLPSAAATAIRRGGTLRLVLSLVEAPDAGIPDRRSLRITEVRWY